MQQAALGHLDHLIARAGVKPGERAGFRAPRRQHGPPPRGRGRGVQRHDLRRDPARREGRAHALELPRGDEGVRGVLQLTAAAAREMAAGRADPVGRGRQDADIREALALRRAGHLLAGQGPRGKERALGHAIAARAEAQDPVAAHSRSARRSVKPDAIQRASSSRNRAPSAAPS